MTYLDPNQFKIFQDKFEPMTYSLNFARVFSSWRTSEQESYASVSRRSAHDKASEGRSQRSKIPQISGWIGVDLDGTLAYYDGWKGPGHIGKPVPAMAKRVRKWLEQGCDVRIFTARACEPERVHYIEAWCETHFGV